MTQTTSPTPPTSTSTGSSLLGSLGWGKKKAPASEIKHSSSAVALPALNRAKEEAAAAEAGRVAHSVPGSRIASRRGSVESLQEKLGGVGAGTSEGGGEQLMGEDGSFPAPLWKDDPVASLCVSGAFFGAGLFALIFSLLP